MVGFNFNIYCMKEIICCNPWCKVRISVSEEWDSKQCPKCVGFEGLSGGVTWTEKKYEGSRFDGQAHQISIKIDRAGDKKGLW